MDFLDYMDDDSGENWDEVFVKWNSVSQKWKKARMTSQAQWDPWAIIKVKNKLNIYESYNINPKLYLF